MRGKLRFARAHTVFSLEAFTSFRAGWPGQAYHLFDPTGREDFPSTGMETRASERAPRYSTGMTAGVLQYP